MDQVPQTHTEEDRDFLESNGADARWLHESRNVMERENSDPKLFQQQSKRHIALFFIIPSFVIMLAMVISVIVESFQTDKPLENYLEFFLAIAGMLNAAFGYILAHYFRKD